MHGNNKQMESDKYPKSRQYKQKAPSEKVGAFFVTVAGTLTRLTLWMPWRLSTIRIVRTSFNVEHIPSTPGISATR